MTEELKKTCLSIINELPKRVDGNFDFDSHDVISKLDLPENSICFKANLWETVSEDEKEKARHKLHREIGKWMENNQESLGIVSVSKESSANYKGVETLNATWRKR